MKKKEICFILDWYPTKINNGCVFAKHLICAIADQGYSCTVIAPRILSKDVFKKVNSVSYKREEYTKKGSRIRIFMPFYLHMSSNKYMIKSSMNNHYNAVMKTIRKENLKPDLMYGHFIYQCGLTAARVGEKLQIPSYCACGESSLRLEKGSLPYQTGMSCGNWKSILSKLSGVVCVSGNNKSLLIDNQFIDSSVKCEIFPNAVDETKFYKMDKQTCRKELGFPQDAFIVAYTGAFSSNKGMDRLCKALETCENVYSVFMGQGMLEPEGDRILFKGRVPNDNVAKYLNAADVFVLPTRSEGCCNAIIEALSCGVPVISSDLAFNDEILNEKNSLRIDVEDVSQIRESILKLYSSPELCEKLAYGAEQSAKELNIETRARRIIEFLKI